MSSTTRIIFSLTLATAPVAFSHAQDMTWDVNGGWLTAKQGSTAIMLQGEGPAADVLVDGKYILETHPSEPHTEATSEGGWLTRYITPVGELYDRIEPFKTLGADAWRRSLVYRNTSDMTQDLLDAQMAIRPALAEKTHPWQPKNFWMAQSPSGAIVCLSYDGLYDHHSLRLDAKGQPGHTTHARWRLKPGEQATIGAQGIWIVPGKTTVPREAYRDEAQRWYEAIGLTIPQDTPAWIYEAILYEICAGGHADSRFSDGGGFDAMIAQVGHLAALGVSAVWLQAPQMHKTPPDPVNGGWNLYDPLDFDRIDPILGGPDALKRLTAAFHAHGLRLIGELVPHGGHSVQAAALDPWWTRTRTGEPQRNWGGYGMDYSSPEWQEVMRKAASVLSREYGMQGIRIDVADGSGPNWGSPLTYHASRSELGGAVDMLKAIHEGLREGSPTPILIPESDNTVEFFRLTPVGYGHGSWFLMGRDIPQHIHEPQVMVNMIRDFLENERGSLPRGTRVIRTLNNHDTAIEYGRTHFRYGVGLSRALYGICLTVEGIPMLYQEEDIGSFKAMAAMNRARRSIPEFAYGKPDYTGITFNPDVFCVLRTGDNAWGVGLSNLSGHAIEGTVRLPEHTDINDGASVHDAVTERNTTITNHSFPWKLAPYETSLIRIGLAPGKHAEMTTSPLPDRDHGVSVSKLAITPEPEGFTINAGHMRATLAAGPGPWHNTTDVNGVIICTADYGSLTIEPMPDGTWGITVRIDTAKTDASAELQVQQASRWHVSGRTAVLEDRVLRRHYPFPKQTDYQWTRDMSWGPMPNGRLYNHVAPCGRLWQSVLEPLHPEESVVAFEDDSGGKLAVTNIQTTAQNIVLTDRTDETTVDPYGLALRFPSEDMDLAPGVRLFGLNHPWEMDKYPSPSHTVQETLFILQYLTPDTPNVWGKAERLPVDRPRYQVDLSHEQIHSSQGRYWYEKPGSVAWRHLPPAPGLFQIRFDLRHSERNKDAHELADAYEIRANGQPVSLTWTAWGTYQTGNAFFGHALTPPIDLSRGMNTIEITTKKPWCAVSGVFHLVTASDASK